KLQPSGGLISVTGTPGDRVERLYVRAGDPVKKGQKLVDLGSLGDRLLEKTLAHARLADAEGKLKALARAQAQALAKLAAQSESLKLKSKSEEETQKNAIDALESQEEVAK